MHAPSDPRQPKPQRAILRVVDGQDRLDESLADRVEEFVAILDPPIQRTMADVEDAGQFPHRQRVEIRRRRDRLEDAVATDLRRPTALPRSD